MLVVLVQINFATFAGKVSVVRWSADRYRLSGTTEKVAELVSLEKYGVSELSKPPLSHLRQ